MITAPKTSNQQLRGVFFMAANAFLLAVVGILFEFSGLTGSQMSFATSALGTSLAFAAICASKGETTLTKYHGLALLNGLVNGGATIFFLYLSIDLIDPAGTTVVQIFICIVIALAIEKFKLKKAPHWLSVISIITGFAGMATMCQKDFAGTRITTNYLVGMFYALVSGATGVAYFILIKLSANKVPESWNWMSYMLGCAAPSVPSLFHTYHLPSCSLRIKAVGLLAAFTQTISALMAVKGFMLIKASAAYVFQFLASVLAFVLQVIFLPNLFSWVSCIGALLIIVAIGIQLLVILKFETSEQKHVEAELQETKLQ
ncbi:uncharacterized protein LOC134845960 isoform X3 [Symsagittifera roscoffensis]|uniref:uncharacterized protein LOC134845960 isoform X3 n=1 Tax=Symsagittifera roscoffensis TaxID=84072 RepID=UPI00307C1E6C